MKFLKKVQAKGDGVKYSYHSTQIDLYDCCSEKDFGYSRTQDLVPKESVYREYEQIEHKMIPVLVDDPREEYGYESNPHITCLYGLTNENDYFKLRKKLKDFGPIEFEIGEIASFRNDDTPYDVIILTIKSPKLLKLHESMKNTFKNEYKYPTYKPHMTLAYVKKGECRDIEGKCKWSGTKYSANKILWSHIDKYYLDIPLKEK